MQNAGHAGHGSPSESNRDDEDHCDFHSLQDVEQGIGVEVGGFAEAALPTAQSRAAQEEADRLLAEEVQRQLNRSSVSGGLAEMQVRL